MKSDLLGFAHPSALKKKIFKTQPGAEICILTVFWDCKGIIHLTYMVVGRKSIRRLM
jgi:hypothetical protein